MGPLKIQKYRYHGITSRPIKKLPFRRPRFGEQILKKRRPFKSIRRYNKGRGYMILQNPSSKIHLDDEDRLLYNDDLKKNRPKKRTLEELLIWSEQQFSKRNHSLYRYKQAYDKVRHSHCSNRPVCERKKYKTFVNVSSMKTSSIDYFKRLQRYFRRKWTIRKATNVLFIMPGNKAIKVRIRLNVTWQQYMKRVKYNRRKNIELQRYLQSRRHCKYLRMYRRHNRDEFTILATQFLSIVGKSLEKRNSRYLNRNIRKTVIAARSIPFFHFPERKHLFHHGLRFIDSTNNTEMF